MGYFNKIKLKNFRNFKKYDGELATYAQVKKAHEKGANWCNYGWSEGQMALYPIQQEYYDKMIKTKINDCGGEPGVNGGYFPNKNIVAKDFLVEYPLGSDICNYRKNKDQLEYLYPEVDFNEIEI